MSIRAEGLSKKYLIGRHNAGANGNLRETLANAISSLNPGKRRQPVSSEFWALKDLNFDIPSGQVVGIIGRNGAGKSTLLKLLSRITEPTTGMFEYTGRMASLLEVGTGFHPELTGRENIFLNGAILGMTRNEIRGKFDEIVAFSEVEAFLETPVKRYSSGMYMRLAFAIAAHLDPEIMIIDEVLAVGDVEFQRKCLGRMEEMAGHGRTVLFVSHNIPAIRSLCNRVLLLRQGELIEDSTNVAYVIGKYADLRQRTQEWSREPVNMPPGAKMTFQQVRLSLDGEQPNHILNIEAELLSHDRHQPAFIAYDITDVMMSPVLEAFPLAIPFIPYSPRGVTVLTSITLPPLIPGIYRVTPWIGSHHTSTYDYPKAILEFEITSNPDPKRTFPYTADHGCVIAPSTVSLS